VTLSGAEVDIYQLRDGELVSFQIN